MSHVEPPDPEARLSAASSAGENRAASPGFPKTRWTMILNAQQDDPDALRAFCQTYWFPLYAYARRLGLSVTDAEDLVQGFFERLLTNESISAATRERGRLRSWLLHSLKNFAGEQWRRSRALKRGSGKVVAMDALTAEQRLNLEPRNAVTPELEFDRCWAREILDRARERMRQAYTEAGKAQVFEVMAFQTTPGESGPGYVEIARRLELSEATARVTAFKFRQRYRRFVEEATVETVASHDDLNEELAYLQQVFQEPAS